jgi:diaminopimelate epimerase
VYSRPGQIDPERSVLIRNAGGVATASLRVFRGQWHPVLEGNATFIYRATVDPAALARGLAAAGEREPYPDEVGAYSALDEQNANRLRAAGIHTAAIHTAAIETAAIETAGIETGAIQTADAQTA